MTACGNPIAVIETNHGTIKAELYKDKAPESVKNFMELAKQGKYEDTIFHRVVKGFVIQGGDFENGNGTGGYAYEGPGTTVVLETSKGLKHVQGALSMARNGFDRNSNASQFFIVTPEDGADFLDGEYSMFGKVIEGMEVVTKIEGVKVGPNDVPLKDVVVKNITIE